MPVAEPEHGEAPHAVCVVGEDAAVEADELIALCAERLGSYKKPRAITLTREPLPKSAVGKIMRKTLREPHWQGHDRRVSGT